MVGSSRAGIKAGVSESALKRKSSGSQRASPRPETPKELPPLLSPLPANLDNSPLSEAQPLASSKSKNERIDGERSQIQPGKRKIEYESSPEKKRVKRSESPEVPIRKDKIGGIPRLLSPDLPSVIEKALDEVQEEKKKHQTVEERHEKARQPGAKGVARKTVKPKSGRKRASEASPDPDLEDEYSEEEEVKSQSLIVKLKYKRKNIKNIDRILRLAPRPGASGKTRAEQPSLKASALPKDDESSEDEIPLAKAAATMKRPAASSKDETVLKAGKKNLDVPGTSRAAQAGTSSSSKKPTSAPSNRHESPVPSGPSNKNLLSTPKKSEAIKSVAMRRVDSSEAQSRTPQPAAMSTPSSVSRSTVSDSRPTNPELLEKLRADQMKCGQLALKLKRKMDDILKQKIKPRPEISPKEKRLGVATGLEAMIVYMNSHTLVDRLFPSRSSDGWVQVLGLMNWLETESRDIDVLHALLLQLSALSKEFLERSYIDQMSKDPKDAELVTRLCRNSISRTNDWIEAEKSKGPLVPHGGTSILGPGSDIKDITQYAIGILTAYSRSEKTGWRKDSEFDTVKGTWV